MGDYDGDGLIDLFIGGGGGLRVALNVGTKTQPAFDRRQLLLDPEGNALILKKLTQEDIQKTLKYGYPNPSGEFKSYITPTDWDNDGVLDLLVTSSYCRKGQNPVEFFRGVQTDKGIRFEQKRALFTAANGRKVFPGSCPSVKVLDYNQDGVMDLLWGASVLTNSGFKIDQIRNWQYENSEELNIEQAGKDKGRLIKPGENLEAYRKRNLERYQKMAASAKKRGHTVNIPEEFSKPFTEETKQKMTLRHRGLVYVMYGQKNSRAAVAKTTMAQDYAMPDYYKEAEKSIQGKVDGPVSYSLTVPDKKKTGYVTGFKASVKLDIQDGWHLYADSEANRKNGYSITKVEFEMPNPYKKPENPRKFRGFKTRGAMEISGLDIQGGVEKYTGKGVSFTQTFIAVSVDPGTYPIKAKIHYQACNADGCLAPVIEEIDAVIEFVK